MRQISQCLFALILLATAIESGAQTCAPNCRDINASIIWDPQTNVFHAKILWSDILSNDNCALPVQYDYQFVSTSAGGSSSDVGNEEYFIVNDPCAILDRTLTVRISNNLGSCMANISFKAGPPVIEGRVFTTYCYDTLIADPLDWDPPVGRVACSDNPVTARFVADRVQAFDCTPDQDTAKVIYREFEIIDKYRQRGSAFDTIVVLSMPQITASTIYCAPKDTSYCGVYEGGPFILVPDLTGPGCDTVYLFNEDWEPYAFDPKCGLQVHVDKWKLDDPCGPSYKVVVDVKQNCYSMPQTMCSVSPPAGGPGGSNVFEMVAPGYWRCEYWIVDLDTVPPYVAVKYDKIQGQNLIPSQFSNQDQYTDAYHCFETPISAELLSSDHYQPVITIPTTNHECAAHTYIPPICAYDEWGGIKQVKARIIDYNRFTSSNFSTHHDLGIGTFVAEATNERCEFYHDPEDGAPDFGYCYEFHERVKLPKSENPYVVFYEIYDDCHLIDTVYAYLLVKDRTRPVAEVDKGVTVSIGSKKVWVDAATFDEGSWDNCGVNFLLARRTDWYDACIDLCDETTWCCVGPHKDTLYTAVLETDKKIDEVEAHYAKTLQWLKDDGQECAALLYNAWKYDLMKYATLECIDHPYQVDSRYFREVFTACYTEYFSDTDPAPSSKSTTFNDKSDCFGEFESLAAHPGLGCLHSFGNGAKMPLSKESLQRQIDLYEQIGGGWSEAVPFDCTDACGPVTVEILAMDYWCNWSKAWTTVWVEDKSPISIEKEVYDTEINCVTYKASRYGYKDEVHPVSLEFLVEEAKRGEQAALDSLDEIFGGYCKAWTDPYGNYVDEYGIEIDCDIVFTDRTCNCTKLDTQIRIYDDHLGYIWKDSTYTKCYYEDADILLQKGIIAVNCASNVQCEQEIWCEFDHCGQGVIYRKWKIWQECAPLPDHANLHVPDTLTRTQRIWVGNDCLLDKYMFDLPQDLTVYACELQYDDNGSTQVGGVAAPEHTGYPVYRFDDDCRIVGVGYEDKVHKIVGGDEGCYKIVRTWYLADWCDGKPSDLYWWKNRPGTYFSAIQKILVVDTLPPVCSITGPTENNGTIETIGCNYDLDVTVAVEDVCGWSDYAWELKGFNKGADSLINSGYGQPPEPKAEWFDLTIPGLSAGEYVLKVLITDICQNESYCEYLFTIESEKSPAAVCLTSLTAELVPWDTDGNGLSDTAATVIWANEFDQSSSAPCGADNEELEFYIELIDGIGDDTLDFEVDLDSLLLGCEHIGTHNVRMWVYHPATQTTDFCDVVLIVQDNMNGCSEDMEQSDSSAALIGSIENELGERIELVEVVADADASIASIASGSDGSYHFDVPMGTIIRVTPHKDVMPLNGVSTMDMVFILNHITEIEMLPSAYRRLAADVTRDGFINALDLQHMRELILGEVSAFPNSESWRFVTKAYEFISDAPESENVAQSVTISANQPTMSHDFIGVKMGDVDLDNDPTRKAPRSAAAWILEMEDMMLERGQEYSIPIRSADQRHLWGYQFTLETDADAVTISDIVLPENSPAAMENFGLSRMQEGMLTTSWNTTTQGRTIEAGENLFEITFKARRSILLSEVVTINSKVTDAAYFVDEAIGEVGLSFGGVTSTALWQHEQIRLEQNLPNPFTDETLIPFYLPRASFVDLSIIDVTGREVWRQQKNYPAGQHSVILRSSDLAGSQLYWYVLRTDTGTDAKKMILMN